LKKIDLKEKRAMLFELAGVWFQIFMSAPPEARGDTKIRTGVQILIWEPGTRNLVFGSVGAPSEAAQVLCVEKAVRSHLKKATTSGDCANESKLQFPGSVTVNYNGQILQASCSGLLSEEDVALDIMNLSYILNLPPIKVCKNIRYCEGTLPACFDNEEHWFYPFVNSRQVFDPKKMPHL